MYYFAAILTFILGASIGSFISVVNHRIKHNEPGIFFGRSKCPNCKTQLKSLDLIPIFSYILNGGKCRYCNKKISSTYVALELFTGFSFLAIFTMYPITDSPTALIPFIAYLVYTGIFSAIFFYDLENKEIPNIFLYGIIIAGFIGSLLIKTPDLENMLIAVIIAVFFFGGQIVLSKGKWLGSGDLLLAIGIGLILGPAKTVLMIVLSYTLGAAISITLLITKKANRKSQVPFAPFLILGTLLAIYFGDSIVNWYLQTLTF